MTVLYSTGYCNSLLGTNSFKEIFAYGVIDLYGGAMPTDPDAAFTHTLLARVTKDGGAFTEGVTTNGLSLGTPASRAVSMAAENWKYTGLAAGTITWGVLRGNAADDKGASTTLPRIMFTVGKTTGELQVTVVDVAVGTPGVVQSFTYALAASG